MLYLDTLDNFDENTTPPNGFPKVHREAMEKTANACKYFQPLVQNGVRKSCFYCAHLDTQVFSCGKLDKLVIPYEWR